MPMPKLSSSIQAMLVRATSNSLEDPDAGRPANELAEFANKYYTQTERELIGLRPLSPKTIEGIKQDKITPPTAVEVADAIDEANRAHSHYNRVGAGAALAAVGAVGLMASSPASGLLILLGLGMLAAADVVLLVSKSNDLEASTNLVEVATKQNTFARAARMQGAS